MNKSMPKKEAGFTFAELTFAMLILVLFFKLLVSFEVRFRKCFLLFRAVVVEWIRVPPKPKGNHTF